MSNINPGGVIASFDRFTIVDVRSPEEWNSFHLEKTIHIPLDQLERRIKEIPKHKPVVCLCRSGNRSETATLILNEHDFEARNLTGGILAWIKVQKDKDFISEGEYKERVKKINGFD